MKARLWKGPFAGKVVPCNGQTTLVYRGPKPMTRRQRYEYERNAYQNYQIYAGMDLSKTMYPQIEAVYRMCIRSGYHGTEPQTHPDGSIFYEFDSKRDLP